jgi:hypothetical protein
MKRGRTMGLEKFDTETEKLCRRCGEMKERRFFNINRNSPDGLQTACIACRRKRGDYGHPSGKAKGKAKTKGALSRGDVSISAEGHRVKAKRGKIVKAPEYVRKMIQRAKDEGLGHLVRDLAE